MKSWNQHTKKNEISARTVGWQPSKLASARSCCSSWTFWAAAVSAARREWTCPKQNLTTVLSQHAIATSSLSMSGKLEDTVMTIRLCANTKKQEQWYSLGQTGKSMFHPFNAPLRVWSSQITWNQGLRWKPIRAPSPHLQDAEAALASPGILHLSKQTAQPLPKPLLYYFTSKNTQSTYLGCIFSTSIAAK